MQEYWANTNQKEFTNYIVPKFLAVFPEMTQYTVEDHLDVSYLELPSPQRKLKILVSTRDKELTIGFSAGPGIFDWHIHMFENESLDEKIKRAAAIINEIIQGKTEIIYSSIWGYFPGNSEDFECIKKDQEKDEIIELRCWNEF